MKSLRPLCSTFLYVHSLNQERCEESVKNPTKVKNSVEGNCGLRYGRPSESFGPSVTLSSRNLRFWSTIFELVGGPRLAWKTFERSELYLST